MAAEEIDISWIHDPVAANMTTPTSTDGLLAPVLTSVVEFVTPMQTVQREAEQLVSQLRDSAFPQPDAARLLVTLCGDQKLGKEWSDAGGRAGVPAALVHIAKIADAALQEESVVALGRLVSQHPENQSAAAAAGAIGVLLQLAQSSDAALQSSSVVALGDLLSRHHENQSAAAAAGFSIGVLLQLAKSSDVALNVFRALKSLMSMNLPCQLELLKLADDSNQKAALQAFEQLVEAASRQENPFPELLHNLRKTYGTRDGPGGLSELHAWCEQARTAVNADVIPSDEAFTVLTKETRQIRGSCFAFAAVRSFNRR